jgi:tetratricopeptide (TPR) repeat protein
MIRANIGVVWLPALLFAAGCAVQDGSAELADAQRSLEEGRACVRKGLLPEAIVFFTQAVKANPDLAEGWYERAKVEIKLRLDPKTEGDPRAYEQNALDDFSMAVRKNPAYADAYFNRAMILCSRAQFKLAADDLLNAIRFNPPDPEAHRWLGDLYEKKFDDRIVLAMEHYEKYVDLGGTDPVIREKVRVWKDFKRTIPAPTPAAQNRPSTAEEERKAQELHSKGLELLKNPDKNDAVKAFEELLSSYGHTKYVQGKLQALQAVVAAFKKKDAQK